MKLFGAKPAQQGPEVPWLVTWRDSGGRFAMDLPFRVVNAIQTACNGPNKCRVGILLGSVERGLAGDQFLQIIHAIPLGTDEKGQLDQAARDRLTACSAAPDKPDKAVITVGLFVPESAREPHDVCALVADYKPLFPSSLAVAVVSRNGVAQFYEWLPANDKLIPMSPELRLLSPFSPPQPDPLAGYRPTSTPGVPTAAASAPPVVAHPPDSARPATAFDMPVRPMPVTAPPASDPTGVTVRFDVPRWVLAAFLLLGIGMLGTGIWYVQMIVRRTESSAPRQSPTSTSAGVQTAPGRRLDLQVSRRGNDLLISWDRNLQTTIGATHGVLEITDGKEPQYLPLSSRDLISGQVLYVPRSQDIEIQLTAFTASTSLHETIRVIQPNASIITTPRPLASPQNPAPPRVPPDQRSRTGPIQSPVVPDMTPNTVSKAGSPATTSTRERADGAVREFVLPPIEARTADQKPAGTLRLEPVAAPPVVTAAAQRPSELQTEIVTVPPVQTPPPEPKPQPQQTQIQQPQLQQPQVQPSAPAISATPRVVDFRPPVPIRQVKPVVPDNVKRMLVKDTTVSVKIKVAAGGNVLSAEAERAPGVTGLLTTIAVETARSWHFRPATVDGKPAPADYTLTFMFRR